MAPPCCACVSVRRPTGRGPTILSVRSRTSAADFQHNGAVTDRDPLELSVLGALVSGFESPSTVATRLGVARDDVAPLLERCLLDGLVSRLDLAGTPVYSLTARGLEAIGSAPGASPSAADSVGPLARSPLVARPLGAGDGEAGGRVAGAAPDVVAPDGATPDVVAPDVVAPDAEVGDAPADGAGAAEVAAGDVAARDRAPAGLADHEAGVPPPARPADVAVPGQLAAIAEPTEPAPNPVKWRHVVYAVAYVVLGLFFLLFLHTVVGLLAVVAGLVLGGVALRPLLRSDDVRVTTR
jgi:hypothetical protein